MDRIMCLARWIALSSALAACSHQADAEGGGGGAAGTFSIPIESTYPQGYGGSAGVTTGSNSGFVLSPSGECRLFVNDQPCSAEAFETENIPLDMYVMFDRSGSMCSCVDPPLIGNPCPDPNCRKTRIEAIREAMSGFLGDTGSNGIGVGVGYFGQQPIGAADCRPETYSIPSVTIATLPDNAANVMASLNTADPIGETPTGGAIRGACSYARQWQAEHTDRQVVILFVTDGEPKAPVSCPNGAGACCPTLVDATQAASDCLNGEIGIRTYVLGVGPFLQNLAQIAVAGGTSKAYLVQEGQDVAAQVLAALNQIRGDAAIPCEFAIPRPAQGQSLDLTKVNIAYHSATDCEGKIFYNVKSQSACTSNGGWYFDDPTQPSLVKLCPSSCSEVSGPGGSLFFEIGCQTASPIL
jgi:hypothetical protein